MSKQSLAAALLATAVAIVLVITNPPRPLLSAVQPIATVVDRPDGRISEEKSVNQIQSGPSAATPDSSGPDNSSQSNRAIIKSRLPAPVNEVEPVGNNEPSQVSAVSYIITDINNNEIDGKNPDQIRSIASITKLVTAAVVLDVFPVDKIFILSDEAAAVVGNSSQFSVGTKFNRIEAIVAMLLQSANDVSYQVALEYGLEEFMALMNKKVNRYGLTQTSFVDPSGLSAGNVSTARELARLTNQLYRDYPDIFILSTRPSLNIAGHEWYSTNPMMGYQGWLGGKNGYIAASGRTLTSMVSTANGPQVIVTLGSDYSDNGSDTKMLLSN